MYNMYSTVHTCDMCIYIEIYIEISCVFRWLVLCSYSGKFYQVAVSAADMIFRAFTKTRNSATTSKEPPSSGD